MNPCPDNVKAKILVERGEFTFDILIDQTKLEVEESIYSHPETYQNESTARRHADRWLERYSRSGEDGRRKQCGFDSVEQCRRPSKSARNPVPKRLC